MWKKNLKVMFLENVPNTSFFHKQHFYKQRQAEIS